MKELTAENFTNEVLESDKCVIVDFWADWCPPCHDLTSIIDEVAKGNTQIKAVKVNVDDNPELADKYEIVNMPMLLIFKDGNVIEKSAGLISKEQLLSLLPK